MNFIKSTLNTIKLNDPSIHSSLEILLYPFFRVMIYYKIAKFFYDRKRYFFARYFSEKGKKKTGIEIHPGAKIGNNFFIDHGEGVVIGETAIIGNNVVIYHGVTLGGIKKSKEKRHPTIEDNVLIGAHAIILGNITIGKNSKIGAGAVVLNDIPPNSTAVGIPAKIIK